MLWAQFSVRITFHVATGFFLVSTNTGAFSQGLIGGTAAGGAAGAALGGTALALLGPIGVTVGAATGGLVGGALGSVSGAVVGAAGKVATEGMDKDHLKSLGSALEPSTSAIIAVFSEVTVSKHKFREELKERKEGIDEIVNLMATDITEKLRNDLDVAYHMAIMEDGVVMTQVTMDCFAANITQMVLTPDAATAKQVTVTPKVAAAEEMVVTGEGVAGAAAVITPHAVEYETEEFEA